MVEVEHHPQRPLVSHEVAWSENRRLSIDSSGQFSDAPPQYHAEQADERRQSLHRANSNFIADINQMPTQDDDCLNDPQQQEEDGGENSESDEELELNRMISTIGFGRYHRRVLALCGLGWLADNMWMQCVACILPRVQQHFAISNARIGLLSSSMFLGLMCGALIWGPVSDRFGRLVAYRWTLVVSGTFGLLASTVSSFSLLCLCLFGLGSGVGGNMPVDGAIFLEFIPREKRHLLTMLSIFFSIGSVVSSAAALALLPPFSCPDDSGPSGCDVSKQNNGWRYLLITMALTTFLMVVMRNLCFRLHESPKFLLQNNRRSDVVIVLKKIANFNGGTAKPSSHIAEAGSGRSGSGSNTNVVGEEGVDAHSSLMSGSPDPNTQHDNSEHPAWLEWPEVGNQNERTSVSGIHDDQQQNRSPRTMRMRIHSWRQSLKSALDLSEHRKLLRPLFAPPLLRTTVLIWAIWATVAMGFTMFNVFLPKLLETHSGGSSSNLTTGIESTAAGSHVKQVRVYRDALIYAVSGVPGSIIGSWMVGTRLGRIYSMALSTFVSGLALVAFAFSAKAHSSALTIVSSSVFGLMSTLMFAVIYAYTPEVFHPSVRGTACGMASALGRVAGIIAPLITGLLFSISTTVPLYVSVGLLWAACGCMIALPIETRDIAA
ncbi:hypothetical protein GGI25_005346 [Coemansia spiralis]|uniref:Major facilitator superfamily (MFS) profile domain-containing protein n=2 Tax=Coemansia TaxID=4863 RepID=A0A9W8G2U0_9FUNG|nr:major facilitator superfamily domain-containing protein [Coemansia spiralis]KAJ1986290.1 hypothetical protein EDC05_006348 [Coemansia umbellata]KAJ2619700.1 hypothetical protein GGI26_005601 [Coemansia sp. RSA 1358]KAJ2671847.1 hypothetical protein GGI25_005346 [Coemansia spiralis]